MKLSIVVITANPTEKQYAWKEALESYCGMADEVIIVDGGTEPIVFPNTKVRVVHIPDPEVWNWAEHAKRLNRGLDEATGDWIFKADIDWIFHEKSFALVREKLSKFDTLLCTMQKMNYYPTMQYVQKGEIPMIINGKFKHRIRFGKDLEKYTDLTYPILWDEQTVDEHGVPIGKLITQKDWGKTSEEFWNFDYTFKTIEASKKQFLRSSLGHKEYFGETKWGNDEEEAWQVFLSHMRGLYKRAEKVAGLDALPAPIRTRIMQLTPEQFGYTGWDLMEV